MEEPTHDGAPATEAPQTAPHSEWRRDHWHQRAWSPSAPWHDGSAVWAATANPHRHSPWFQATFEDIPSAIAAIHGEREPDGWTTEFGTVERPFPHELGGGQPDPGPA